VIGNDDQLLLCTDGATDMVDDVDIELVLNSARSASLRVAAWLISR